MALAPKLKEDPKEWRTFTLSTCAAVTLVTFQLHRKGRILDSTWYGILGVIAVVALTALIYPRAFRLFYRGGMTLGFYIGQVVGRVLLMGVFLLAMIPIGFVLRILGRDLLGRRFDKSASTYWQPSRAAGSLERMF
jgi:uncharacterized membrane protein